jgi:hypothetical protein
MLTLSGMASEGMMAQPGNETDFTEKHCLPDNRPDTHATMTMFQGHLSHGGFSQDSDRRYDTVRY